MKMTKTGSSVTHLEEWADEVGEAGHEAGEAGHPHVGLGRPDHQQLQVGGQWVGGGGQGQSPRAPALVYHNAQPEQPVTPK